MSATAVIERGRRVTDDEAGLRACDRCEGVGELVQRREEGRHVEERFQCGECGRVWSVFGVRRRRRGEAAT